MRIFLFILLLAACASVYLYVQGPGVIIELAQRIMRENGLPEVDFQVSHVSLETVTLEGIRIGRQGAVKIPRISAVFTWRELIDGEVGEISIDDLEITVRQTIHRNERGLSFGELDPFVYGTVNEPESDTATTDFNWPFRRLALGNARVTVLDDTDSLILAMTIDGDVQRRPDGGLEIGPGRVTATSPEVDLAAAISASISAEAVLSARMRLEQGTASLQGFAIQAEEGMMELETPLDDLTSLVAAARLKVAEIALPFGFATTGELSLSIRQNQLQAAVNVQDTDRGIIGELMVAAPLTEPLAAQPVSIDLSLDATDAGLLPPGLLPIEVTRGAAELHLSTQDTIGNLQSLSGVDGLLSLAEAFPAITVSIAGRDIETPALPGPAAIHALFRLDHGENGTIALFAPEGMKAILTPRDERQWRDALGALRQSDDLSPLLLSLTAAKDAPLVLFNPGEVLQKSRLAGQLRLEGGSLPAMHADVTMAAIVDPIAGIFDMSVDRIHLAIDQAAIDVFTLTDIALFLTASATEKAATGTAELTGSISGGEDAYFHIPAADLHIPLQWQYREKSVEIALPDCAAFNAPIIRRTDFQVSLQDVTTCLRQDGDRLLHIDLDTDGAGLSGSVNALLETQGRDIVVTRQDGWRARLQGQGNTVRLFAGLGTNQAVAFDTDIALGTVILPDNLIRLDGLRLSAFGKNLYEGAEAKLAGTVTDLKKPFRFAPFTLTADGIASELDALTATGQISVRGSPLTVEWEATHTLSTQKGRASLSVLPFEFGFGVNKLSDITSVAAGIVSRPTGQFLGAASANWADGAGCGNADVLIRQASAVLPGSGVVPLQGEISLGQLGLTGKLCADEGGITSQAGQLLLDTMEFAGDQISAKAINANIDIETFLPFTTAPAQELSVGAVDLGFPLTDGVAVFRVTDTAQFDLNALSFNWAGGVVSVTPLTLSPDLPLEGIDLAVKGVQLAKLTELVPDKGVSGEGILDGRLPIRLTDEGPAVQHGYLEAREPGILRYERSLQEGETPSAVDDVLSNLQYSKLRLDVNGGLRGGVTIGLNVEGKNPDYLDGYPVVLDVNVNGPLGAIMNDGLATYKVPSQILERMRRFGQLQ